MSNPSQTRLPPDAFNPSAPSAVASRAQIVPGLTPAAGALLVCAIMGLLVALANLVRWIPVAMQTWEIGVLPWTRNMLIFASLMLGQSLLALAGAIAMLRQRWRPVAIVGAAAVVLPACGCYLLPAGVGIWCLTILCSQSGRTAFARAT